MERVSWIASRDGATAYRETEGEIEVKARAGTSCARGARATWDIVGA